MYESMKKKINDQDPNDQKYNKYKIGLGLYLLACFTLYYLKTQKAILLTNEDLLTAVKKAQTNTIYVIRNNLKEKDDQSKEEKIVDNSRKIYLKIDGIQYVCFVPDIKLFY